MPMEKTFQPRLAEARISAKWLDARAFAAGANAKPKADGTPADPFSIMIPPPNVTGSLHMGHAFNNTLQDILIRWHRMRGFDTLWQPGTDHAGIATQMVVERELALTQQPTRRELGREKFLEKVWAQKGKSEAHILDQLKHLGASCDWDRTAFTMSGAPGAPAGEDGNFHDAVIKVFVDMYNKGLIYRGKRLVNWDPHFETAISDLEVENIEVPGHMWHFKYPLAGGETYEYVEKDADGAITLRETRDYISIATTRPETMLGDGAVAVHPSDERYAPIIGKLCEIPVGPVEHRRLIPIITDEYPDPVFGSGAVKITGAHDFNDYAVAKRAGIPCYRLMDTRGAMRADCAPYAEAAAMAQTISRSWLVTKGYVPVGFAEQPYNPTEAEVDTLNLVPDELRGLDRFEARRRVVEAITAEGLAVMVPAPLPTPEAGKMPTMGATMNAEITGEARDGVEMIPFVESKPIMQPFGDRSKVVIEPMLTDQWFVDTGLIVEPALEAVRSGRTKIIPPSGEKTYYHWLENIEPWCISRQLWWGHQIPVWYGPDIGEDGDYKAPGQKAFCGSSFADVQAQAQAHYGPGYVIEEFLNFDPQEFARRYNEKATADGRPLMADPVVTQNRELFEVEETPNKIIIRLGRDEDVLDTWFSSGLWPIGTLGWPNWTPDEQKYFPTSVLVTGQDILFFWVARMMMMQLAVVNDIPFHTVYLHGLVRDAKGKKMSKSLGNVIDPLQIIDEYGADALRFANAAMASLGGTLKLDTQRIAGYRNFGTKLWNACRFAEMNHVWDNHTTSAPPKPNATVNRWIMTETARTRAEVDAALNDYRFDQAADALYKFVWGQVCDWYVEFAKPLFDGPDAAETRQTMAWVLDQCMILLHPMMPFVTEELWATTGKRAKMLVHTDWPTCGAELSDPAAESEMGWVTTVIDEIRSARAQMHVPVGLKLDMLSLAMDRNATAYWSRNEALIKRLARIETLTPADKAPKGAMTIAVDGATFAIPLEGIIDITEEKSRLTKTLDKLTKEITGLKGRLNNPNFAKSAPEEVVDEARTNLEAREDEAAKLNAALARLAELG